MKVGLFGTGAYGLALSSILTNNNCEVVMWTKFQEEKELLESNRGNNQYIPNYKLPNNVIITTSVEECIKDKDLLIIAIPAAFVDSLCNEMKSYINNNHILIATKGIEQGTGLFMDQLVSKYLNTSNVAVISGPSFAIDLVTGMPAGLSIASKSAETITIVKNALQNNYIKLRDTNDITGIEICGSIKNVIALAAGMLDGLKANDSTKAMFITEAMHDMEEILDAFECNKRTVLSYAGIGDLILTCTSTKSRNFSFGKLIGEKPDRIKIEEYLKNKTVEGYYTLESIYQLLKDKEVTIPIIDLIYEIVVKGKDPELLLEFLVFKS
ncbi:MAG: NAD(P)H-dependent glycerol-3-phosphate dehydrogenase [Bacilli bacterium]|nr:NAD(P)H-dependent glycerol-3-phosphate dehydrogenase [Bacilli bacterium]